MGDIKTLYFADIYNKNREQVMDNNSVLKVLGLMYESLGSTIESQYIMKLVPGSSYGWALSLPPDAATLLVNENFMSFSNNGIDVEIQEHNINIPVLPQGFHALNESDYGFDKTSIKWHGVLVGDNLVEEVKLEDNQAYNAYIEAKEGAIFEMATTTGAIAAGVPGVLGFPKKKKKNNIILGNTDEEEKKERKEDFGQRLDNILNEMPR